MSSLRSVADSRLEVARLILDVFANRREAARQALARRLGFPDDGYGWDYLWCWADDQGGDEMRDVLFVPDALADDLDRLEAIFQIEAGVYCPTIDEVYDVPGHVLSVWDYLYESLRKPQQFMTESIEGEIPSVMIRTGDLHDLVRALAEVAIANAPDRGRISLVVFPDCATVRFEIRSSGPRLSPDLIEILSGDSPVSRALGQHDEHLASRIALGFVRLVAAHYGGCAGAERAPGGTNLLWCALPSVPGHTRQAEP